MSLDAASWAAPIWRASPPTWPPPADVLIAAIIIAFLMGACAGSFLGVVIHRLPRGLSIVHPPSRCGACGTRLAWFENVPILSWLLLRGRCRHCGTAIPASCLVMELGVATASALLVWGVLTHPFLWCPALIAASLPMAAVGAGAAVLLAVLWLLIAAVLIDLEHLIIPDEISKGLQTLAIPLAALTGTNLIWPWNPQWWLRRWDALDGWVGTPGTAATRLALIAGAGLVLCALSLPLARRIYGGLSEPWEERDHRAMRLGAWWWIGCTGLWLAVAVALPLVLGPAVMALEWHPGRLFCLSLAQAVLGSLVGWWLPWLVGLVGTAAFRRNAMGYGDVKLYAAIGAFLGPAGALAAFMLATVAGTLVGIPARLLGAGREMPFGPSLAIGAVLAIVLGPWLSHLVLANLLLRT
jgi:leader peptidase (prepilin peptidase)/N-methyltransferase